FRSTVVALASTASRRSIQREEKRDFPCRVLGRIGSVYCVALLRLRIQATDRPRLGLCGIRCADDLPEVADGVVPFERERQRRSGRHVRDERPEERTFAMELVEVIRTILS